jgi:predicted small integral membrane protein
MPNVTILGQVGPQVASDGTQVPLRQGKSGEGIVSELNGRYYEQAVRGNTYMAQAIVTAPVIFSTAAGTGGPLLWNGSANVNAVLLAAGFGITVVTTVAAALGITGNAGQAAAPTATTAIDSRANLRIGGGASACTPYRVGTPTNAGNFFLPFADLHTGALTVDNLGIAWIDLGGMIVVPPNCWASIAASATATTTVMQSALVWTEVPV